MNESLLLQFLAYQYNEASYEEALEAINTPNNNKTYIMIGVTYPHMRIHMNHIHHKTEGAILRNSCDLYFTNHLRMFFTLQTADENRFRGMDRSTTFFVQLPDL
jgi:hypothetical protein